MRHIFIIFVLCFAFLTLGGVLAPEASANSVIFYDNRDAFIGASSLTPP